MIPHLVNPVYRHNAKSLGLRYLFRYALMPGHEHSRQWLGPLTLLLQRGGAQ
jgi:hypothetical protein